MLVETDLGKQISEVESMLGGGVYWGYEYTVQTIQGGLLCQL